MRSIAVSCATDAAYELRSLSRYKERFTQCAVRAGAPEIASLVRKARAGKTGHSMTRSARTIMAGGSFTPMAFAVFALTTNSTGCR